MQLKRWRTLGLMLVALVAIYMVMQWQEARYSIKSSSFIGLEQEEVGRIVIVEGEESADLVRLDTLWVLTGHETEILRNWRMDAIFNTVLGAKRESIISENAAKWDTYGVDSTGRQIMVYDLKGELESHWIVGQSSSNYQASYVRRPDEDAVYMTDRSIYHFLGAAPDFWLEPPPEPDTTGVVE